MKSINTRLQEMTNKLSSKELFESNGLGNEINFHVFDYDPEDDEFGNPWSPGYDRYKPWIYGNQVINN